MSKLIKVLSFIVIMLVVICYSTNSYALNMNLNENSANNTNTTSNTTEDTNTTNTTSNTSSTSESGNRGNFTTQITVSTQELTISNALSICLIAVGIVLILLSIAILIKLKK